MGGNGMTGGSPTEAQPRRGRSQARELGLISLGQRYWLWRSAAPHPEYFAKGLGASRSR